MVNTAEMTAIKSEIERSLINPYGNTLIYRTYTEVENDFGEIEESGAVDTTFIGVTDQYVTSRASPSSAGRLEGGQSLVIVKEDDVRSVGDIIVIDSKEYIVLEVQPLKAADVNIAFVLTVGLR